MASNMQRAKFKSEWNRHSYKLLSGGCGCDDVGSFFLSRRSEFVSKEEQRVK